MKITEGALLLYAVTDRSFLKGESLIAQVERAICGGVTCVQLREKNLGHDEFLKEAIDMKELCSRYNIPLIINDNVDIAVKSGADGVHIGQNDMDIKTARKILGNDMIIGASARNVPMARSAEADGADYIGCGAVFGTNTKSDALTISPDILRDITHAVSIPVVAIGGVNRYNLNRLSGTGIAGAAIVSGIFAAEDIEGECRELRKIIETVVE